MVVGRGRGVFKVVMEGSGKEALLDVTGGGGVTGASHRGVGV